MQCGRMDVERVVRARVASGEVHGAAWLVDRGGSVTGGVAGIAGPDSIFRISSVTKPVVAALAMALIDDGVLGLDDDVDEWLPELADRRVLRTPGSPLDDTVPADRPITVRDVLEFRLGIGMDFAGPFPGAVLGALAERGLPVGPPAPQQSPAARRVDARRRRCPARCAARRALALQHGRAGARRPARPCRGSRRCPSCWPRACSTRSACRTRGSTSPPNGSRGSDRQWLGDDVYDEADGQWSRPPAFPDAAAGLVVDGGGPARVRDDAPRPRGDRARARSR